MRNLIIIGHSHSQVLYRGVQQNLSNQVNCENIDLNSPEAKAAGSDLEKFASYIQNEIIKAAIKISKQNKFIETIQNHRQFICDNDIVIATCIGGNAHNVISLVKVWNDFDFVLETRPDLPLDETAQIIPQRAIYDLFLPRIAKEGLDKLNVIHQLFTGRVINIETPPPLGDDAYILKHIDKYFIDNFGGDLQVIPPILRHKIWKISSMIYEDFCREKGIYYFGTPANTMVDDLFLRREGYTSNATHGNAWYGAIMVKSALDRFYQEEN